MYFFFLTVNGLGYVREGRHRELNGEVVYRLQQMTDDKRKDTVTCNARWQAHTTAGCDGG